MPRRTPQTPAPAQSDAGAPARAHIAAMSGNDQSLRAAAARRVRRALIGLRLYRTRSIAGDEPTTPRREFNRSMLIASADMLNPDDAAAVALVAEALMSDPNPGAQLVDHFDRCRREAANFNAALRAGNAPKAGQRAHPDDRASRDFPPALPRKAGVASAGRPSLAALLRRRD